MARGWESKSVEAQTEEAVARRSAKSKRKEPALDRINVETTVKRDSLLLSRTRIVHELELAQNPRYRELLNRTLAGLDAQLNVFQAH